MEPLSSATEAREFEIVRKGGYDQDQVDAFMVRVAQLALELEEQLNAAHSKIHSLERQIGETKGAEQSVGKAFIAAADAKHHLIEDAERRARDIVEKALSRADDLQAPRRELDARRRRVDEMLAEAERTRDAVDAEADGLLEAARRQADRIVSEARRDALAAIDESKKEAEDWVRQAHAEHQRVALMLRGLKAAVRDMLDTAAGEHEAIKVVLAEEVEAADTSVRLPT